MTMAVDTCKPNKIPLHARRQCMESCGVCVFSERSPAIRASYKHFLINPRNTVQIKLLDSSESSKVVPSMLVDSNHSKSKIDL